MSDAFAATAITAWRGAGRLMSPALQLLLALRTRAGKEDAARRGERLGLAARPRPAGGLVWVHAASVGETVSILPLIERLTTRGLGVLLTTGTVTSAAIAATRLPAGAVHQYVPLDVAPWIGRFLDHWRPGLAIFVESEIWPTTVVELSRRGIPQVLVNARMSERSFGRWRASGGIARALFGRLTLALAQAEGDGERLARLGVGRVEITGNLKFDGRALDVDAGELARLAALIEGRPRWLAASTHPGEEAIAADAHAALAARRAGLLTILAPRHPQRGDEIRALMEAHGLRVASRSRGEDPTSATDVWLADTIGEMGLLYRLSEVAFVGGTITPRGGQNPIEPARLDVAVVHGPSTHNFRDVYRDFDGNGGARAIEGGDALASAIDELLGEEATRAAQIAAARAVIERSTGALERLLAALEPHLAPLAAERAP